MTEIQLCEEMADREKLTLLTQLVSWSEEGRSFAHDYYGEITEVLKKFDESNNCSCPLHTLLNYFKCLIDGSITYDDFVKGRRSILNGHTIGFVYGEENLLDEEDSSSSSELEAEPALL